MTVLVLGLVLFIGIHMLPSMQTTRGNLLNRFGENGYKGLFSLVALLGLGLIIYGKSIAPFVHVYVLPYGVRHPAMLLILFAFILFVASMIPCNIRRWVKHPQLLAVLLWGGAHLLVNGDVASILLFGGMSLFAVIGLISAIVRGKGPSPEKKPIWRDILVLVVGLVSYALVVKFHGVLFGIPLIAA